MGEADDDEVFEEAKKTPAVEPDLKNLKITFSMTKFQFILCRLNIIPGDRASAGIILT